MCKAAAACGCCRLEQLSGSGGHCSLHGRLTCQLSWGWLLWLLLLVLLVRMLSLLLRRPRPCRPSSCWWLQPEQKRRHQSVKTDHSPHLQDSTAQTAGIQVSQAADCLN